MMGGGSIKSRIVLVVAILSLGANVIMFTAPASNRTQGTAGDGFADDIDLEKIDRTAQNKDEAGVATAGVLSPDDPSECNAAKITGVADFEQGRLEKLAKYLDKKDYQALSDDLMGMGLPASMVEMLVYSYLNADAAAGADHQYWRATSSKPSQSARQLLASNSAKRAQLVRIFGEQVKDDPALAGLFRPYQQNLAFLSSDKQVALQELQLSALTATAPQSPKALEQEIKNILGADDYNEYQLRESLTAKRLQQDLAAFDYSEQDYRAIYNIKHEYDGGPGAGGIMQVQSAAISGADFGLNGMQRSVNTAEEDAIRAYLGEERYREYSLSRQPDFRRMKDVADANGVDRNDYLTAYEVLQRARKQMNDVQQNASLNTDDRNQRINTVLSDTNVQLTSIVGENVAEEFVSQVLRGPVLYRN